jgi:hypothetical protein
MIRAAAALLLLATGCARPIRDEAALRRAIATGQVRLSDAVVEIHREIAAPAELDVEGLGPQSVLRAAADFQGRALIVFENARRVRLKGFAIDGSRDGLEQRTGLPPYDVPFHRFTRSNGILLTVRGDPHREDPGFGQRLAKSGGAQ